MKGLEFKSVISDLSEVTSQVSLESFEKSFLQIQKSMEEYEVLFRQERFESERIASHTFLNY